MPDLLPGERFEGRRKMPGGKKIIFLGDSITDAGHNFQPVREGELGLGDGYVRRIATMLHGEEGIFSLPAGRFE